MNEQPVRFLPGRIPWRPVAATMLILTGIASGIALDFVLSYKPHVTLHTGGAYLILLLLILLYSIAYETKRTLLRVHVWLTFLLFSGVLSFIHLDDAPGRLVFESCSLIPRPPAPELYWTVALILMNTGVLTLHLVWLGRGARARSG